MSVFDIADKNNVYIDDRPVTSYVVHIFIERQREYVRVGSGFAQGHNCTDSQCLADWQAMSANLATFYGN